MKKSNIYRTGSLLLAVGLAVGACGSDSGDDAGTADSVSPTGEGTDHAAEQASSSPAEGVENDSITWGIIADLTGPTAANGVPFADGIEAYFAMTNEAGGVHGRTIEALIEDDKFDPATQRAAFDKLVDQTPVLGMSGFANSGSQVALAPAIGESGVPVLGTVTVTEEALALPNFFNTACPIQPQPYLAVGYIAEQLGIDEPTVAAAIIDVPAGHEYSGFLVDAVARSGGSMTEFVLPLGAPDLSAQIQGIRELGPDIITLASSESQAVLLLKGLAQFGVEIDAVGINFNGTKAVYESVPQEVGERYTFSSCFTPPGVDAPGSDEMRTAAAAYADASNLASADFTAGWVAGMYIVEALQRVGEQPTRQAVIDVLNDDFTVDTGGLAAPSLYTADDHRGPKSVRFFAWDYEVGEFVALGEYSDYDAYLP